ncbi:MAG: DUF4834 family protein [Prevotella sp.]|jgi:hypothetical protein
MLLRIFLFVFLLIIALFVLSAVTLHRLLHQTGLDKIIDMLKGKTKPSQHQQGASKRAGWHKRQTQTPTGDTIIDRRTPEEANQKIFHKNEGEYVEFEEENS